jgi:hypothetical protein
MRCVHHTEVLRLRNIILHTYRSSTMGDLYKVSIELLFIEIRISADILSIPQDIIFYYFVINKKHLPISS